MSKQNAPRRAGGKVIRSNVSNESAGATVNRDPAQVSVRAVLGDVEAEEIGRAMLSVLGPVSLAAHFRGMLVIEEPLPVS